VQDVAPTETFGSIAAALKALTLTTDAVFSKIENRVADERARLGVLNERIARARTRIQQMTGACAAPAGSGLQVRPRFLRLCLCAVGYNAEV